MKTFLVLFSVLLSLACQKEGIPGKNSFYCKVNGKEFEPRFIHGQISSISNVLLLTGSQADGEEIQLLMPPEIQPGTYTLNNSEENPNIIQNGFLLQVKYQQNDESFGFNKTGVLVISEHNTSGKQITGTFEFTTMPVTGGSQTFTISEGTFNMSY